MQHWNHAAQVTVMSWKPTVKLHDEDSGLSCFRCHSGQPANQARLSQSGAPIPPLALEWESCSHGALEVIAPRSYTPFEPPSFLLPRWRKHSLSLSPSVLSLSLVQRFVTSAPDCGLLKSLEVVSGSQLPLSLLCGLGGVWWRRGVGGRGLRCCRGWWG